MTIDPRSLAIFATLVALILAATAIVASAQNAPAYPSRPHYGWNAHRFIEVHHTRRRARVWREEYRPRREASGDRCRPVLAVVGDQYATEDGAKEESRKAWRQTARWAWGERYMVVENADDIFYECGRSSVGSVVGQVFYRCRISARPCRAESQRGDR